MIAQAFTTHGDLARSVIVCISFRVAFVFVIAATIRDLPYAFAQHNVLLGLITIKSGTLGCLDYFDQRRLDPIGEIPEPRAVANYYSTIAKFAQNA